MNNPSGLSLVNKLAFVKRDFELVLKGQQLPLEIVDIPPWVKVKQGLTSNYERRLKLYLECAEAKQMSWGTILSTVKEEYREKFNTGFVNLYSPFK
jgi:hypothetical protein